VTKPEFREKHSELIEYYQYIEMHLKGICAEILADQERDWYDRLNDYESDPFGKLVMQIKALQSQKQLALFSESDFEALENLRKARNYWVHQCFCGDTPVIFRKGNVRNPKHAQELSCALDDAIDWDKRITNVMRSLRNLEPLV